MIINEINLQTMKIQVKNEQDEKSTEISSKLSTYEDKPRENEHKWNTDTAHVTPDNSIVIQILRLWNLLWQHELQQHL